MVTTQFSVFLCIGGGGTRIEVLYLLILGTNRIIIIFTYLYLFFIPWCTASIWGWCIPCNS